MATGLSKGGIVIALAIEIAGCAHRLQAPACNEAVSSWNTISQQVADYRDNVAILQRSVEKQKPYLAGAKYIFDAKLGTDSTKNLIQQPRPSATQFTADQDR